MQPEGGINKTKVTQQANDRARTLETRFMDLSWTPVLLLLNEREHPRVPWLLKLTSDWSSGSQVNAWTSGFKDSFLGLRSF